MGKFVSTEDKLGVYFQHGAVCCNVSNIENVCINVYTVFVLNYCKEGT